MEDSHFSIKEFGTHIGLDLINFVRAKRYSSIRVFLHDGTRKSPGNISFEIIQQGGGKSPCLIFPDTLKGWSVTQLSYYPERDGIAFDKLLGILTISLRDGGRMELSNFRSKA